MAEEPRKDTSLPQRLGVRLVERTKTQRKMAIGPAAADQ